MAVNGSIVSVGTTPTALATVPFHSHKRSFSLQNVGTVDVFIGGADVSPSSYGFRLLPGAALTVDLERGETIYGDVASGTNNVAVLSAGNE